MQMRKRKWRNSIAKREELGLEKRWKEKETAARMAKHETRIFLHQLDGEWGGLGEGVTGEKGKFEIEAENFY